MFAPGRYALPNHEFSGSIIQFYISLIEDQGINSVVCICCSAQLVIECQLGCPIFYVLLLISQIKEDEWENS